MGLGQHRQKVVGTQQSTIEALVTLGHDGQMHIAALKPRRQADAALLDEPNVDAGMAPSVTRQKVRQDALDRLRRRAYAQRPGLSLRERTRPLPEGFGIGQESATALEQILSLRGQLETAPDPIKQRHT